MRPNFYFTCSLREDTHKKSFFSGCTTKVRVLREGYPPSPLELSDPIVCGLWPLIKRMTLNYEGNHKKTNIVSGNISHEN